MALAILALLGVLLCGASRVAADPPALDVRVVAAQKFVVLPAKALLYASIDSQSSSPASVNWSLVSGSGSVTFSAANFPETYVDFSTFGPFTLRVEVNDGQGHLASDQIEILVYPEGMPYDFSPTEYVAQYDSTGREARYSYPYIFQGYENMDGGDSEGGLTHPDSNRGFVKIFRIQGSPDQPQITEIARIDGTHTPRPANWEQEPFKLYPREGFELLNGYLYMGMEGGCARMGGRCVYLFVVDVRDPYHPKFVGRDFRVGAHSIGAASIAGVPYIYTSAGRIFGQTNPLPSVESPTDFELKYDLNSVMSPAPLTVPHIHDVKAYLVPISGGRERWRMFVSTMPGGNLHGLWVFDLTDPTKPKKVARFLYLHGGVTHDTEPFPAAYLRGYSSAVIVKDEANNGPLSILDTSMLDDPATIGTDLGTINCQTEGSSCLLKQFWGDTFTGIPHWSDISNNILAVGSYAGGVNFFDLAHGPADVRQIYRHHKIPMVVEGATFMREYPNFLLAPGRQGGVGFHILGLNPHVWSPLSVSGNEITSQRYADGSFDITQMTGTVTNTGDAPLSYSIKKTRPWITVSDAGTACVGVGGSCSGILGPAESHQIVVALNQEAGALPEGLQRDFASIEISDGQYVVASKQITLNLDPGRPTVTTLSAYSGTWGDTVTIWGTNFFDPPLIVPWGNQVGFFLPATPIGSSLQSWSALISQSASEITFAVPPVPSGDYYIGVKKNSAGNAAYSSHQSAALLGPFNIVAPTATPSPTPTPPPPATPPPTATVAPTMTPKPRQLTRALQRKVDKCVKSVLAKSRRVSKSRARKQCEAKVRRAAKWY